MPSRPSIRPLASALLLTLLAGCGIKGALYLPPPPAAPVAPVAPTASAPAAEQSAPAVDSSKPVESPLSPRPDSEK